MTNQSKKRKFLATTLTASMVAAAVAPVAGAAAADVKTFPDVPADHAYAQVISDMANAGIVKGEPNGNFNLGGKITRAEAAQMTAGLLSLKTGAEANVTKFEDVKGDVWYTGAINSLVDKGVIAGVTEKTFRPNEKFEQAHIDRNDMQFLYSDGELFHFMNVDNYEQIALNAETVEDSLKYVKENEMVKVCAYKGSVFDIEPPLSVELEITSTEPGFKGDTAQGATKPAIVETGATVYVPLFIEQNEKIRIDTRTGEYLGRA